MSPDEARAILGVGPDVSPAELESAFRRLANLFLAKRVEAMGATAVAVARKRSRRLRDAYELLKR